MHRAHADAVRPRCGVALSVLGLCLAWGCSCGEDPPPVATPTRAVVADPEPPTEPRPPEPGPARPSPNRPDTGVVREVRRLVSEARAAEHGGDHDAALALFDQALALVPGQPRVLCEAGFIAHRAGRSALAAHRIDTALRVFDGLPAATEVGGDLRVPYAMCLYNRGLVDEALGESLDAAEHYECSLELRENSVVRTALSRVRGGPVLAPGDDAAEHLAGVAFTSGVRGAVLETTDVNLLVSALASGFSGFDDFSAARQVPETTQVSVRETLVVAGHPSVTLLDVESADYPLSSERLVIAVHTATGFVLSAVDTGGGDQTDHGSFGGSSPTAVRASWSGELLRIEIEIESNSGYMSEVSPDGEDEEPCYELYEDRHESTSLVVCRVTPNLDCYELPLRARHLGERRDLMCDGAGEDNPTETSEAVAEAPIELELRLDPNGVTVGAIRGATSPYESLEVRAYGWDELFGQRLSFRPLTDEDLASEAAESDEPTDNEEEPTD